MKPKIYCFSNVVGGGEGIAYAMAEDGTVLGSHFCTHEGFVKGDLRVLEGPRQDKHGAYDEHYPEGYEMEFVLARDVRGHLKLQEAFVLNHKQGEEDV